MSSGLAIDAGPDPTNTSPLERLGYGGPVVGIVVWLSVALDALGADR